MRNATLALVAASLVLQASPVLARELAGVNLPESVTVDGKALQINGAGIRKKIGFKVYVGALYLEKAATDLGAILAADQTRSVHMHFVRSVDKEKIINAFKEGFENNSKDKAAALSPQLDKVAAAMTDLKDGSELVVTYVPGKGTTIGIKGGASVTIEGKDFGDAILRNWLGPKPADGSLKEAMLAGK